MQFRLGFSTSSKPQAPFLTYPRDHFPRTIVKHKHEPQPFSQANLQPMSKPHLLLEFHLTGSSASSPQTLWVEDLCARVNCYISEPLLYFNTAAVCLQRTRSSTAEWPKLTRQCVHMRMTEWVRSACVYAWWREKEKEKARRSFWIFVQCVLANVGMCAYLSVLNGCFLSNKPQPNSSTFSFSSPFFFFFCIGWKKRRVKPNGTSVVQRAL